MIKPDDEKKWKHVCNGDKKSFEQLYYTHAESLYQFGLTFTSKTELIEDCLQELFILIFNKSENLEEDVNVCAYLMKSFRNNLIRLLNKEKKYFCNDHDESYFDVTFSVQKSIISTEEEQIQRRTIKEGIKTLSARQKEIIYLKYTRGFSYDEIANIMNIGIEACRNLNSTAISTLRKRAYFKDVISFVS